MVSDIKDGQVKVKEKDVMASTLNKLPFCAKARQEHVGQWHDDMCPRALLSLKPEVMSLNSVALEIH